MIATLILLAISPLRLDGAADYSKRHGGEVLVIREAGRTVLDQQSAAAKRGERYAGLSITKSLAAVTFLAAQSDGILRLDEPACATLTEWKKSPLKREIRIRDLLNLQAGLSSGYEALYRRKIRDKNTAALALGMAAAPGSQFAYGPACYEALEELLARKLEPLGLTPLAYMQRRLFNYLDASADPWRKDLVGNSYFSTGALLSVPQFLRFGDIVLNQGRPNLTRWFSADLSPLKDPRVGLPIYALGFWRNQGVRLTNALTVNIECAIGETKDLSFWKRARISPEAPADLLAMVGSGGQRLYVVPSRKLVILRLGNTRNFDDAAFLRELF